jgi:transcription elongation factor GreB
LTAGSAPRACKEAESVTSKAFTSEETPDDPIVVPQRAPLPTDVPNYVTARGLALLRDELAGLERERGSLADAVLDDVERERRRKVNGVRIAALSNRIASAEVVDPRRQPHDQVRFGATVTVRASDDTVSRYTIVGVDEAAPAAGRIAFLAPLARALTGLAVGDTARLRIGSGEHELVVEAIAYDDGTDA